jgi:galactose mutarotase-like enzyme
VITLRTAQMTVDVDVPNGAVTVAVRDATGRNALQHYDWETPALPSRGLSYGNDDLDFHAAFRGGWQETFPNSGLPSVVDGVPHPFHGEATTSRWTTLEQSETRCVLHVPARSPLELRRTMTLDPERPVLRLEEVVTNVGAVPVDFVWGHHPTFPATAGARIDYPAGARIRPDVERTAGVALPATDWPVARLTEGGTVDLSIVPDQPVHRLAYVDELREGWAAVRQPDGAPSVALAWDRATFPYSWVWMMRDDPGFPFYGRARCLAIESQTSWPYDGLAGARRRNMAHRLEAGETRSAWYTMALFENTGAPVTGVTRDGDVAFGEASGA